MVLEAGCVWKKDKPGQAHLEANGSAGRRAIRVEGVKEEPGDLGFPRAAQEAADEREPTSQSAVGH